MEKNWTELTNLRYMNRRLYEYGISILEGKKEDGGTGYDVYDLWKDQFVGSIFCGKEGKYSLTWNEVIEIVNSVMSTR